MKLLSLKTNRSNCYEINIFFVGEQPRKKYKKGTSRNTVYLGLVEVVHFCLRDFFSQREEY